MGQLMERRARREWLFCTRYRSYDANIHCQQPLQNLVVVKEVPSWNCELVYSRLQGDGITHLRNNQEVKRQGRDRK